MRILAEHTYNVRNWSENRTRRPAGLANHIVCELLGFLLFGRDFTFFTTMTAFVLVPYIEKFLGTFSDVARLRTGVEARIFVQTGVDAEVQITSFILFGR